MKPAIARQASLQIGAALITVAVAIASIGCDNGRFEEFLRRTGRIEQGMTIAEVTTVAGAPDEIISKIGADTPDYADEACCRKANADAAMLYRFDDCDWMCQHFGRWFSNGRDTWVVCLDEHRLVVDTYLQMIQY